MVFSFTFLLYFHLLKPYQKSPKLLLTQDIQEGIAKVPYLPRDKNLAFLIVDLSQTIATANKEEGATGSRTASGGWENNWVTRPINGADNFPEFI